MGKISEIRLQKEPAKWQLKGLKDEELIFLCDSEKNNQKYSLKKSKVAPFPPAKISNLKS